MDLSCSTYRVVCSDSVRLTDSPSEQQLSVFTHRTANNGIYLGWCLCSVRNHGGKYRRSSCIFFAHGLRIPGPHRPHKPFQWEEMAFFLGCLCLPCDWVLKGHCMAVPGSVRRDLWTFLSWGLGCCSSASHLNVSSHLYHILSFLPPSLQSRKRKKYFNNGVWQLYFEYWKESGLFWQYLFIHFNECCMSEVENFFFEKFKLALFIVSLIDVQLACACRSSLLKRGKRKLPHHVLDPIWRTDWQDSLDIKSTEYRAGMYVIF